MDPKKRKHDHKEIEWNRREELFTRLLMRYCDDEEVDENMVLSLDVCFNLAFHVNSEVTETCRRKLFKNTAEVKESDCSHKNRKLNHDFRNCITLGMRQTQPNFDLYDHAKTAH